jgi:hypothetical protein
MALIDQNIGVNTSNIFAHSGTLISNKKVFAFDKLFS